MTIYTNGNDSGSFSIPTVDLAAYLDDPMSSTAKATILEIRNACITSGFFQIIGHGISRDLQDTVLDCAKTLFDLPPEEKQRLRSADGRGYELIGSQTLQQGMKADLKEGYFIGPDIPDDLPSYRDFFYPNKWPPSNLIDPKTFKEPLLEYRSQLVALSNKLLEILAIGLPFNNDPKLFSGFATDPLAVVRLLHYPPQENLDDPLQVGAGAHTDFGAITLLMQDSKGGLQVQHTATDSWIDVTPNPNAYVVNVGDMLQMWTGGEYRSNIHRVINKSGGHRYSVPFFFDGNLDYVLRPLDGSGDGTGVTVEDFMRERFKRSYN